LKVQRDGRSVTVTVTADGDDQTVSHAGAALVAEVVDRLGLTRCDLRALRDQPGLFGPVASDATAWRVIDAVCEHGALDVLRAARAGARAGVRVPDGGPQVRLRANLRRMGEEMLGQVPGRGRHVRLKRKTDCVDAAQRYETEVP
jgi:hypothetical protein